MIDNNTIPAEQYSFKDFLFKNRRNRFLLCMAAIGIIVQLAVFKYLYPYASFIHGDSFSYIRAANLNQNVNTYMIGYSKFLRLFSVFTTSDTILVIFQYIFIQVSSLFLLSTIFFFYKPNRITQYILVIFISSNPLFLHLANLISSDCLFAAFSFIWFALLLWVIYKPSIQIIACLLITLFLTFTFRYNALIYPFITGVAFWISNLILRNKIIGILSSILICGLFVWYTSYNYKEITGYWQYSPFSGWQIANNAMYAYRYVDSSDRKHVPQKFAALNKMITQYFDSTHDTKKYPVEGIQASTYYMWSPGLPLMQYKNRIYYKDSTSEFKKWASLGPFYKSYGLYVIEQYPWHYIRYFLWPNTLKYYAVPIEFLESYNSGFNEVTKNAKDWFGYKSLNIKTRMESNVVWVLDFYPILSGIINFLMLCILLFFITLKAWKYNSNLSKVMLIGSIVWILNACFSIGASSVALRFQSFPILLTFTLVVISIDWMLQLALKLKDEMANPNQELDERAEMVPYNPQIENTIKNKLANID
jgi:hypothetical protein